MKRITLIFIVIVIISMISLIFIEDSRAYDDERISVYFYFTWMNEDGTWHEWRNISKEGYMKDQILNIGQPIKCKIRVIPKVNCFFGFELSEIGSPNSFDLLEGTPRATELGRGFKAVPPGTDIERLRENISRYGVPPKIIYVGEPFEYTWVLKPNSNWSCDGCSGAPLNCDFDASFNMNPDDDVIIGVSFAVPLIRGEWAGPRYITNQSDGSIEDNGNHEKKSTPGFEFLVLFVSFILVLFIAMRASRR